MNSIIRPTIGLRYVDDTFTLFDNKDNAVQFLDYLNGRHDHIKFTIEFEQHSEIPSDSIPGYPFQAPTLQFFLNIYL